ncbi:hypothetical protein KBD49_03320 [Myxococcota bacterium]|nr:hypothetical protein [Myxococcota bacterium]
MRILVIGTGRMGRDAARTILGAGWDVTVASRDRDRLAACLKHLDREARRLGDAGSMVGKVGGLLVGTKPEAPFDVLFETVEEDLQSKREVLQWWLPFRAPDGLVLTNSSSLLPWEIRPEVLGLHLFYPSILSGFCEVILPEGGGEPVRQRLVTLAARLGLSSVVQIGARQAQAVNRLMLPSQAWAVHLVGRGLDQEQVDRAFGQAWPGLRPLTLMESVGMKTIARSVAFYRLRMGAEEARSYEALESAIGDRIRRGCWGPAEAPAVSKESAPPVVAAGSMEELTRDAEALFFRTCREAVRSGLLSEDDLRIALAGLFQAPWPPPGPREREWRDRCGMRFRQTGLPWWRPPVVSGMEGTGGPG